MPVTLAYACALALIYLLLSLNVSRQRWLCRVSLGDGDLPVLRAAVRIHANFAEYVPLILLLLALNEASGVGASWLHVIGVTLLIGRLMHPFGMLLPAPNPLRALGMLLTWAALLLAALSGLLHLSA